MWHGVIKLSLYSKRFQFSVHSQSRIPISAPVSKGVNNLGTTLFVLKVWLIPVGQFRVRITQVVTKSTETLVHVICMLPGYNEGAAIKGTSQSSGFAYQMSSMELQERSETNVFQAEHVAVTMEPSNSIISAIRGRRRAQVGDCSLNTFRYKNNTVCQLCMCVCVGGWGGGVYIPEYYCRIFKLK